MREAAALIAEYVLARPALGASRDRAPVVGVCGAQGCGKSTAVAQAALLLAGQGVACATLSLDDFYLTRAERLSLAEAVHPLFAVRGPPGTHDVALARRTLDALAAGRAVTAPTFDKLSDDRAPPERWRDIGPLVGSRRVVLFEGWCLGADPQPAAALAEPVNALERDEDMDAMWRGCVNAALAGPYQSLWDRLDSLIFLRAPSFDVVEGWRLEQEAENVRHDPAGQAMEAAGVRRFVQHFERITRQMLHETPARVRLQLQLDAARRIVSATARDGSLSP
jgi:D-glycerate 3-kinase